MSLDIEALLRRLLAETLDLPGSDALPPEPSMMDMVEWDSFAHIGLLQAVEETFGLRIGPGDIDRTLTLADLASLIASRCGDVKPAENEAATPALDELWESLWRDAPLPSDAVIYVHSRSSDLLRVFPHGLGALMAKLRGPATERTVIFPAFPFTSRSYTDYLQKHPPFSVKDTPPRTGLLAALAMGLPGAIHSAHPLLSEIAVGPQAARVIAAAHLAPEPFHADSPLQRLLELDAFVVGLGVDMGTNAFIHYADDQVRQRLPFPIYQEEPVEFDLELADGSRERRAYLAYSPQATKHIKPRELRPFFRDRPDILLETSREGVPFYRMRLAPFIERCIALAQQHLNQGKLPPWYPDGADANAI